MTVEGQGSEDCPRGRALCASGNVGYQLALAGFYCDFVCLMILERLVCFGILAADVVVLVYTERAQGPHVISLRKAEKHEANYYRQVAKENFG